MGNGFNVEDILRNVLKPSGFMSETGFYIISAFMPNYFSDSRIARVNDIERDYEDNGFISDKEREELNHLYRECAEDAVEGFKERIRKEGEEGLMNWQCTLLMETFLQCYLDDWEHDDDITILDDYDRYFDLSEREEFIENNPDYENWIETDPFESKKIIDDIYTRLIHEAFENFKEMEG